MSNDFIIDLIFINPFYATGLFEYPLKKIKKQRLSDAFSGYRPVG